MSLRERNRHNTLALTQRTAVEMFLHTGFDEVKVRDIADAVGMAPSTLYRYFPTKEAILLWDEHGDSYEEALAEALSQLEPFAALREVFTSAMVGRYEADAEFQLRRVTLIYETPSVYAAAAQADRSDREYLTAVLASHLSAEQRSAASLLARAALTAVDWAFDEWQASGGASQLADLVETAFDRLGNLAAIT